jgi:hypothetical protein
MSAKNKIYIYVDKIRQDKMGCKTNEMKHGRTLERNKAKQN